MRLVQLALLIRLELLNLRIGPSLLLAQEMTPKSLVGVPRIWRLTVLGVSKHRHVASHGSVQAAYRVVTNRPKATSISRKSNDRVSSLGQLPDKSRTLWHSRHCPCLQNAKNHNS